MEFRNIMTFLKIADLGSYSKAAESLGYAQSTLTAQIKNLEDDIGQKLIEKDGRGIRITEKGEIFLDYARKINELINESREALCDENEPKGTLKIGVIESLCTTEMPEILEMFHNKFPQVNIELKLDICSSLRAMLKKNMVDLIMIIDKEIEDGNFVKYYSEYEQMSVVCSPENELAKKEFIDIDDLENSSWILTEKGCSYRKELQEMLKRNNISTEMVLESGSIETIKRFVKRNIGVTLLPRMAVRKDLQKGELVEVRIRQCNFSMFRQILYNKNRYMTNAMKSFFEILNSL